MSGVWPGGGMCQGNSPVWEQQCKMKPERKIQCMEFSRGARAVRHSGEEANFVFTQFEWKW
jgi:hypothetical protein